jgi:hypothetical protein
MRAANPNPKISVQFTGLTHRDEEGHLDWTGQVNVVAEHLDDPLHVQNRTAGSSTRSATCSTRKSART